MIDLYTIELNSERLHLSPVTIQDADSIFQEFNFQVTKYMYPKPANNIAETKEVINRFISKRQSGTDLVMVIAKKDSREFVGLVGIHNIDTSTPEFGIWTKLSAHGNGYGREAVNLLKTWIDSNLTYEYLSYPVDKLNLASRKIPESMGGIIEREFEQINQSGVILNEVEYRIYPTT